MNDQIKFTNKTEDIIYFQAYKNGLYQGSYQIREADKVQYLLDGEVVSSYVFLYNNELVTADLTPITDIHLTEAKLTRPSATYAADQRRFEASIRLRKLHLLID